VRVLIIHNDYQQHGGETVAVQAQLAMLRQHGHEVVLYWKDNREIEQYSLSQRAAFIQRTIYGTNTYQEIRRLVATERPDIAHVHNVFPLISPAVYDALRDAKIPIIQMIHNFRFLCPNGLFYTNGHICERCARGNTWHAVRYRCYRQSRLLSALYASSIGLNRARGTFKAIDRFIANTEFVADKLASSNLVSRDRISVLGNFLPDPVPDPGPFDARQHYIVYLGRLSPEKGVRTLIDAVAGVPSLPLKVAGDGPQSAELKAVVGQRGLAHVEFLGYLTGQPKWYLLRNALASVVPSVWYDNFPFAVLESFAAGTPVVASALGGLPYMVTDHRTGLLFEAGSSEALTERLAWISEHRPDTLAMGRQARLAIEQDYSADNQYHRLMNIYNEVCR
jgi:glycosyltransferase involved in cell wall biosynthesis